MSDDERLEEAVREEYEQEQYIFYSSEEIRDMEEADPPAEFVLNMNKLFRRERWKRKLRAFGKDVACFFVILIGSFYLLFILDADVRATCIQWIKTAVSGGMTDYKAVSSDKSTPSTDKENESVAGFVLEYIPEGYVLKSADMGEDTGKAIYCKETKQLKFSYITTKDTGTLINNEYSNLSHIELNDGTVCDLYKNTSEGYISKLIWQRENFTCTLYVSEIDEHELVQIAEGIKIIDS